MRFEAALILTGSCLSFAASAAIFTSNTTITSTNTNYDGGDIVVIGCTVTIDGPHAFSDVLIIENGAITHTPATNSTSVGVDLTVSNNVVIEAGSVIVADGLGYAPENGLERFNKSCSHTRQTNREHLGVLSWPGLGRWRQPVRRRSVPRLPAAVP